MVSQDTLPEGVRHSERSRVSAPLGAAYSLSRWLGSIDDLSNGTKAKIKGIMSEVFQHAIRYGWLNDGENTIFAVRQSTKRERVTEPLEVAEFRALMLQLSQKSASSASWQIRRSYASAKAWA